MDILEDYREWVLQQEDRIGTHSDDCHMWPRHEKCMIHRLAREVERLRNGAVEWREQLERAADEVERLGGSTPQLDCGADRKSVASQRCRDTGGQPFDSAPVTLTDAEREAVKECLRCAYPATHPTAATLRSLLERLGGGA